MDELIERLRLLEQDHEPDGWPAVRMRDITALLDALEAAREDAHPDDAAVDGAMPALVELVTTLDATGTVTGGRIYFPERQTRELLKKARDALAAQPGGSDNDR